MSVFKEFKEFLREYKIIGLAIAFIIGSATTELVNSLVNDIIMPIISPLFPGESWKNAILKIGPISIRWGSFTSSLIRFIILAFVVFIIAKKILKEDKVAKK